MVYNLSLVCTTLLEIFLLQNLVISLAKSACRLEAALPHLCTIGQMGPASSLTQQTTIRHRLCARHRTTHCDHNMESVMAMRKATDKPQGGYLTTAVTDTIEGKWAGSEFAFLDHIYLRRRKHAVWPWGKRKGHSRPAQKGKEMAETEKAEQWHRAEGSQMSFFTPRLLHDRAKEARGLEWGWLRGLDCTLSVCSAAIKGTPFADAWLTSTDVPVPNKPQVADRQMKIQKELLEVRWQDNPEFLQNPALTWLPNRASQVPPPDLKAAGSHSKNVWPETLTGSGTTGQPGPVGTATPVLIAWRQQAIKE